MFAKNTFWNLVYQLTAVVAGFLVPRAIIGVYGSEVNGLVTSLTQFIGYFALVEAGIRCGDVRPVQAARSGRLEGRQHCRVRVAGFLPEIGCCIPGLAGGALGYLPSVCFGGRAAAMGNRGVDLPFRREGCCRLLLALEV